VDGVRPATGGTAFHSACFSNQPECAEALARAGCDVGRKDRHGETGRGIAEVVGHAAVVARLRVVVSEQLRAAQAAALAAPEPAAAAAAGPFAKDWAIWQREVCADAPTGEGALAWQVCVAAEEGDAAAVVRLLAAGFDPNASVAIRSPTGDVLEEVSATARTPRCARLCSARVNTPTSARAPR
jgi:hypothetical protein